MNRKRSKGRKENILKHALIVCNGQLHKSLINKLINKPRRQTELIAADGASDFLFRHKILPYIIIGDLDSISPAAKKYFTAKKVKIRSIIDQNRNDLEKCLGYAIGKKIKDISIIGFSGKRFDHTINNLSILKKFHRNADIKVYDGKFEYFFINKKTEFASKPGEIVSLIALPLATGVKTKGLKYSLNNETLEFGGRQGSLNKAIQKTVSIELKSGHLLVFRQHSLI